MNEITAADGKVYALPKKPVWRNGPPPEIGWWPASSIDDFCALRFYDGFCWSYAAYPSASSEDAADKAYAKLVPAPSIQWSDRWWLTQPKGYPRSAK